MRKWNAILTAVILILFLLHGIMGGFMLTGIGSSAMKYAGTACMILILVHSGIGIRLSFDTIKAWRQSGGGFFRENRLFFARRISGFAVLALMFVHIGSFSYMGENGLRLRNFTQTRLVLNLLLVASLAVHIISNARPALIAFGIRPFKKHSGDILFVLSAVLLFMAAAFIVYYLRWIRV